jgi:Cu-Zn family superoxide dismutase
MGNNQIVRASYAATFISLALLSTGCDAPAETAAQAEAEIERLGLAEISLADGSSSGTAELQADGESLSLSVEVSGLEPGQRGFHLHTIGLCEGPDFKSAGGHLNPFAKTHGSQSAGGKHLGDLPNIQVDTDGTASVTLLIDTPRSEALPHIFDEDGTAVMIHAGPDDLSSDPAGAAGPRVACGVMVAS